MNTKLDLKATYKYNKIIKFNSWIYLTTIYSKIRKLSLEIKISCSL